MIRRLDQSEGEVAVREGASGGGSGGVSDSIERWLDLAVALARLPERESARLREEMEDHLRSRVGDLMLAGVDERTSVQRAVAELGDAARFAGRYRSARNQPNRRRIMNAMIFGGVGVSLVLSITALTFQSSGPPSGRPTLPRAYTAPQQELAQARVDLTFEEAGYEEVFGRFAEALGKPVRVNWGSLADVGIGPKDKLTLTVGEVSIPTALRIFNESRRDFLADELDIHVGEDVVEVATRRYFDRRDRVLVTYDIEDSLRHDVDVDMAAEAVTNLVESDLWTVHGGDSARIMVVGSLIFVEAPPRIHEQVEWVFAQLSAPEGERAGAEERVKMYPLSHGDAVRVAAVAAEVLGRFGVEVAADPRTNSVIGSGDPLGLAHLETVILSLDRKVEAAAGGPGAAGGGSGGDPVRGAGFVGAGG